MWSELGRTQFASLRFQVGVVVACLPSVRGFGAWEGGVFSCSFWWVKAASLFCVGGGRSIWVFLSSLGVEGSWVFWWCLVLGF